MNDPKREVIPVDFTEIELKVAAEMLKKLDTSRTDIHMISPEEMRARMAPYKSTPYNSKTILRVFNIDIEVYEDGSRDG